MLKKLIPMLCLLIPACGGGIPYGVNAVDGFDVSRYLGTWYEIARLDHSFERGLTNVTAEYIARDDGGIDVLNKGYDRVKLKWKEARGRAYFTGEKTRGMLKVSFFRPFYGGYNILALDKDNYSYSLVCGPDKSYLWILARTKKLDDPVMNRLIDSARTLGFPTDKLIIVEQQ
ncbi:MAG: lipocalin family protein [Spirochaetes bacterium]|nr:lipocalin family protein [Spirochaetota bacterium]